LSPSKAELYAAHPSACPEIDGPLPYLIHPPSELSSTARWIEFRDRTLLPMMKMWTDDAQLPKFLRQVELILFWRSGVPVEQRLWRSD
jgi:hypothetical protein